MIDINEFNIMLRELTDSGGASFDMLCAIAKKHLEPYVRMKCRCDKLMSGKELEDDIMQDVYIRLIRHTLTHFLRCTPDGSINDDAVGFNKWIFSVAKSIFLDYRRREVRAALSRGELPENQEGIISDGSYEDGRAADIRDEKLMRSVAIVLCSDAAVYKTLTWLAHCIFITVGDIPKARAGAMVAKSFEDRTLREMRDMIYGASEELPWLMIDKRSRERIESELLKPYDRDRLMGDIKYREFFMKKGSAESVSDWVSRMNAVIKRESGM